MIDDDVPICPQTAAPTMSPKVFYEFNETMEPTKHPTKPPQEPDPWYASLFKRIEHERTDESEETETSLR